MSRHKHSDELSVLGNLVMTKGLRRVQGHDRLACHVQADTTRPSPLSPGPQRDRQESRQGRRRRRRGTGPQSQKGKELQRDLQRRVEHCSAHDVPGTSDRQPSESKYLKNNTAACQYPGWCPPVLELVARQFSGWSLAGRRVRTTRRTRVPDCSS